ncbi:MAG: 3-deoxy-7-phosphoheptulonate synthase [Rhodothermales bacterium]|nr:3-deoxy-7-phosphoheptulonate synthase [Rhodothermales bacterium]
MVVVMETGAVEPDIQGVIERLNHFGFDVHRSSGEQQIVLGAIGVKPGFDTRHISVLNGVAAVYRVTEPYKFASRAWKTENTVVQAGQHQVGGDALAIMAGPCSVESEEQIHACAELVAAQGATFLRGGAFKPRSSPYSFQGMGKEGLVMLREAADAHNLAVVTEVMEPAQLDLIAQYTDVFQIGARNMQNFSRLKEVGKTRIPVLLKRGMSATVKEWLMSAEYLLAEGNADVILCERGIRTFEDYTRNTLDLSAVPVVKAKSHLPIIVDPSHGTGIRNKVTPMARAAVAAGADGLMIEVHPDPDSAVSDGPQSLYFHQFETLMEQVRAIALVVGRS